MTYKNQMGIFPYKTASRISLLKYTKSACGVDFMLNTADSNERQGWFNLHERYKTDFFEFYFFRKASGFMFLDGDKIELHDNCVLIIPPFKRQEWHVQMEELDYTFLIFQDIYNFISDKYFNSIAWRHRHNIVGNEYLYGRYAHSCRNSQHRKEMKEKEKHYFYSGSRTDFQ